MREKTFGTTPAQGIDREPPELQRLAETYYKAHRAKGHSHARGMAAQRGQRSDIGVARLQQPDVRSQILLV